MGSVKEIEDSEESKETTMGEKYGQNQHVKGRTDYIINLDLLFIWMFDGFLKAASSHIV